jgi:ketosteroid isomerase-like protein
MANEDQSKATVEKFMKTFSEGDIEGVSAGLADGATWWVLGSIEGLSGSYSKEDMIAALPNFKTLYKAGALELRPQSVIAEGNRVAVEAEGFAELNNGRVYNSLYHFVFEVDGDQIVAVKEYLDTAHAHATFFVE